MKLTAWEVVQAIQGDLLAGNPQQSFSGVSTDSRTTLPGELFVPLVGQRYDGHDFIAEALQRGAAGFLTHQKMHLEIPSVQIRVRDTLSALGELAAWVLRKKLKARVVAVAGSNGKTTTKELIAQMLAQRFKTHATLGNYNTEIGLPLTVLNAPEETEMLVLEMGTTTRGDLKKLCAIAPPQIGVLTGIGEEHLETLGDLNGVLAAELELAEHLRGPLIINGDNDDLLHAARATLTRPHPFPPRKRGGPGRGRGRGSKIVTFGLHRRNDYFAESVKVSREGTYFRLHSPPGSVVLSLRLLGRPAVLAALAATATAEQLGFSLHEIASSLESASGPPGRLQLLRDGSLTILHDAYNANPASMREAILCAAQLRQPRERLVFVLGDMLELGDHSERTHREIGHLVCEICPDQLLVVGKWAQLIGDEAQKAKIETLRFATAEEAAETFVGANGRSPLLILLKGSRGMRLERVLEALQRRI
ncbi:UDP-N-acetylmuramoyl-tripeptide--D-alanyl-D-alanine ligase [Candidatus Acetothermia bacterium]|jgi:UDP-N-acetylmuramoyl-tripeptide--D-alanyl-D-alanine ligase|nr:UDP-N-acetylmuramoyl-tripeptide--D-alanyl-D-alanine ligase [Candidatus Acetothermia bacterium]MCI2431362.1 UDP-N-acetylmuramoyl-tripeptide--D-alanyl-D-alanine ligase [Candidatus Acetothermia bacterium]